MTDKKIEDAILRQKTLDTIRDATDISWKRAPLYSGASYQAYYRGFIINVHLGLYSRIDVVFHDEWKQRMEFTFKDRQLYKQVYANLEANILRQEEAAREHAKTKEGLMKKRILDRI